MIDKISRERNRQCLLKEASKVKDIFVSKLLNWWEINKRDFPWRKNEITPYEVMIAEFLLKRTTSTAAAREFTSFLHRFGSVDSIVSIDILELEEVLKPIGLYKQRAKAIKDMAHYILSFEEGVIPNTFDKLIKIPGVGLYTANAVLSFGYKKPASIVDSNVIRVIGRIFSRYIDKPQVNNIQLVTDFLLPLDKHREFNWAILDYGALVCRYTNPLCSYCKVKEMCNWQRNLNSTQLKVAEEKSSYRCCR